MVDFLYSWTGVITMAVLLVALIGVMIYLRSQPDDDE